MSVQGVTKVAVTVADMARMVGLSRARFYELVGAGVFPPPAYGVTNRRPLYDEEQQRACLEVRRRNCGANGRPVLFYAGRSSVPVAGKRKVKPPPKPAPAGGRIAALLDGLSSLGLSATAAAVEDATRRAFPAGTEGVEHGEVIRRVFLLLHRCSVESFGGVTASDVA